jgi:hypothetical protein
VYKFHDQVITAIFGHLHLCKCTRSLVLQHDSANVECEATVNGKQLTGTAKWANMLKMYEVDKHNVCHLLPKVTERHIKPGTQNMMKVSLAAQVMSSTVAAALNCLVTVGKENYAMSLNDTEAYQQFCYVVKLFI